MESAPGTGSSLVNDIVKNIKAKKKRAVLKLKDQVYASKAHNVDSLLSDLGTART